MTLDTNGYKQKLIDRLYQKFLTLEMESNLQPPNIELVGKNIGISPLPTESIPEASGCLRNKMLEENGTSDPL